MPRAVPTEVVHIPQHGGAWSRRLVPTLKGARTIAADWCADGGTSVLLHDGCPLESWSQPVMPAGPRRGRPSGPRRRDVAEGEALAVLGSLLTELAEAEVEAAIAHHRAPIVELADWLDYISPERRPALCWMLQRQCMRDAYEAAVRRLSGSPDPSV